VGKGSPPTTKGYNSDFSGKHGSPEYDEGVSWTHSKLTVDVPLVDPDSIAGTDRYREFQLDMNQSGSGMAHYITLDTVVIYLTDNEPDADGFYGGFKHADTEFTSANGFLQIYDMDDGGDNTILINFEINAGSGKRDMIMWVPDSADWYTYKYVILYTEHGADIYSGDVYEYDKHSKTWELRTWPTQAYPNNDGFEEWGVALYDATKTGYKWNDLNADGNWDGGEPGLPGWTIWIDDGDGVLEAGEPFAITASDGSYTITDIEPGTYDVRELPPAGETGWICSYPSGGFYDDEVFGNGGYNINNFGNYQQPTKSGIKYEDLEGDGLTMDDTGLGGWTIYVYEETGNYGVFDQAEYDAGPIDSTTTSSVAGHEGEYSFDLDPGYYIVAEEEDSLAGDWTQSHPTSGVDTTGITQTVEQLAPYGYAVHLQSGDDDTDNDFANWEQPTKSGIKYEDLEGDGLTMDDTGLGGWTIYVYEETGNYGVFDQAEYDAGPIDSTTTSSVAGHEGEYSFDLDPGYYIVAEEEDSLAGDWTQSHPTSGVDTTGITQTVEQLAPYGYAVHLQSGDDDTDNDFANWEQPVVTCETAVAAQGPGPGQYRFLGASNWFTYIKYYRGDGSVGSPEEYPIFAGQTWRIGTLYVYDEGNHLFVRFVADADPGDCTWEGFSVYHIEVVDWWCQFYSPDSIVKNWNPAPGQCEYGSPLDPMVTDTGYIGLPEDISGYGSKVYIFAHSVFCYSCP